MFGPPRDRDEAIAVLRQAIELGVDHIDTTQYYGPDVANEHIRTALYPYAEGLVRFFPLGSAFSQGSPVLRDPRVIRTAARLGDTPPQVALTWLLSLRPNVLLIPGTSSRHHLEENMAAATIELDAEARELL